MSSVRIADASRQLSQLVNRAAYGRELIVLTSRGQAKAVILGVEAFEDLIGMHKHAQRKLMPLDSLQQQLQQALIEAGYDSREKIVDLVQQVKQEMMTEREQKPIQKLGGE
jgi:prevent-host-death family protein